ncbi:MAG TPA: hypothetical protein VHC43_09345 [Mycobacteriales bacterium]|nr:hypothetical protein [Mycobacteriales bacterium]
MRSQAVGIVRRFESGSRSQELHAADRALWPQLVGLPKLRKHRTRHLGHQPILSSGPLLGRYTGGGAPNPAGWIRRDCPRLVARMSYEVAAGPRNGPALDAVFVFIERRGRALLYFVYP